MACGRPVVTTSITGVADDIRRMGAGKVVEPDDADALSHAIAELLRDDGESARMGDAGRSLVEAKYSCKRVAEQMEAVYMDLLL
jgi:D-inositol-3-phosphate glycosyltransferase